MSNETTFWDIRHIDTFSYSKNTIFRSISNIFNKNQRISPNFLYFRRFIAYNTRIQFGLYAIFLKYQPYLMQ